MHYRARIFQKVRKWCDFTTSLEKCPNVIIDSSRVKGLRDDAILRTLKNKVKDLTGLKNLIFINKRGQIVDIIALV